MNNGENILFSRFSIARRRYGSAKRRESCDAECSATPPGVVHLPEGSKDCEVSGNSEAHQRRESCDAERSATPPGVVHLPEGSKDCEASGNSESHQRRESCDAERSATPPGIVHLPEGSKDSTSELHDETKKGNKGQADFKCEQRLTPRNHCRPVLKGAPFLICSSCYELVQVPAKFAVSRDTILKLRCGSCSAVRSYTYKNPASKKTSQDSIDQLSRGTSTFLVEAPRRAIKQVKQIQPEGAPKGLDRIVPPSWQDVLRSRTGLPTPSLYKVEEPHFTSYKDVMAWVAIGKRRQKGLSHTCMQQVGYKLLGRDDIIQSIMERILLQRNGGSNCTVICINGGSGFGKTSLLRVLYNNKEFMDFFDKRIWIQISKKFDVLMLLRKLIEFSINDHCSIANIDLLQELVVEEITNKKFLLFLDDADIADQQFWTSILEVLNSSAKGSALVMATRSSTDAALRDVTTHSYFLNPLPEENNMMILQQCSCVGIDIQSNPDLMMVAKRFVSMFGTNPLNLKAIGGLLCHANSISLEMDKFEGSGMPLQICHDVLPIHLKDCLAFCSLFPEGYIFDKHHMVLQWMSHGCVRTVEGRKLEDAGVECFNELLCRSFFQFSPVHSDKDDKFVMHELMYKVVESASREKYFKSEDSTSSVPKNILHLSLVSSQFQTVELISRTEELKDLQTFLVVQPEWQPYKISFPTLNLVGLDNFFLKFTSLETLDLSHTDTEELPRSIVSLRNLRYLCVNNTSIRALPSEICSLSNLQILEAKDCRFLTELPGDTKKLLKLRHLDLTKELGYVQLPQGIGQLTELLTLPVFHASSDPSHCSVSELGNLYNLRGCLLLSGLESVKTGSKAQEANLKDKHHLKDLTLQWHDGGINIDDEDEDAENVAEQVLENLQPHSNLHELAIRAYEGSAFPAWMQNSSSLPNLVSLTLDSCSNCTQFPAIAHLPSLKFLSVRKMYDVQILISHTHCAAKFPSLDLLNLWEMYDLEELFEASEGACPRLRKVCISRCPELQRLPCTPSVTELILHCGHQLPDIPELVSLVSLKIEGFHSVKSFTLPSAAALPALKKLEIRSCKQLSSVDGLSALTTVHRLKIAGCPKLVLPGTDSLTT